jgi:hypothetical protein
VTRADLTLSRSSSSARHFFTSAALTKKGRRSEGQNLAPLDIIPRGGGLPRGNRKFGNSHHRLRPAEYKIVSVQRNAARACVAHICCAPPDHRPHTEHVASHALAPLRPARFCGMPAPHIPSAPSVPRIKAKPAVVAARPALSGSARDGVTCAGRDGTDGLQAEQRDAALGSSSAAPVCATALPHVLRPASRRNSRCKPGWHPRNSTIRALAVPPSVAQRHVRPVRDDGRKIEVAA